MPATMATKSGARNAILTRRRCADVGKSMSCSAWVLGRATTNAPTTAGAMYAAKSATNIAAEARTLESD
jgi:hypothetical protein